MRFEPLRETLLTGGIAPRHVRRYLIELSEHLDDLIAEQRTLGYDGEDAALRARARLGGDTELAKAMLEQKSLRSVTARLPWLMFGLVPPLAGLAAAFALIAPLVLIARELHMVAHGGINAPQWFKAVAFAVTGLGNLAFAPAVAAGFAALAFRQRIAMAWPLFAVLLIALLDLHFQTQFPAAGHRGGSIGIGAAAWFSHGQDWLKTWPLSLARLLLTLLPAIFFPRTRSFARQ